MSIRKEIMKIHNDENGADMVEYILVVGAIALPLVAVIIWFWKDISAWAGRLWNGVKGGTTETDPGDLGH